ncbi:MAG: LytTR family DNA-binding domain-containing protein [Ruminococcus sp.]|nr:LytTR family DNA-binding domain-containing protein [Ruminococcus sp.]
MFASVDKAQQKEKYYTIKSGRDYERIALKDVYYLEKQRNYVYFHTVRGVFRERTTLDKKSDLLTKGFLRTHIGYMVNIRHIDRISSDNISLSDDSTIPLSKKYYEDVRKCFFEWMANEI